MKRKAPMSSIEIKENNKLIAEFLGYKYFGFDKEKGVIGGWMIEQRPPIQKLIGLGDIGKRNYLCRSHNDLAFHRSYDWLMPVVEKIESLGYTSHVEFLSVGENRCFFFTHPFNLGHALHKDFEDNCGGARDVKKLNAIYLAVIQFINWYNKNKIA